MLFLTSKKTGTTLPVFLLSVNYPTGIKLTHFINFAKNINAYEAIHGGTHHPFRPCYAEIEPRVKVES